VYGICETVGRLGYALTGLAGSLTLVGYHLQAAPEKVSIAIFKTPKLLDLSAKARTSNAQAENRNTCLTF
jgi:hypothetical protein